MNTYTVTGTYGASMTPCDVFVYETGGIFWYAVEGSHNVNATEQPLEDGVDVETIPDIDCFTASLAIESADDLENEVDE